MNDDDEDEEREETERKERRRGKCIRFHMCTSFTPQLSHFPSHSLLTCRHEMR